MSDHSKRTARWTDTSGRPVAHDPQHPLLRPVDRAEARTNRVLVTLFLLIMPFAVVLGVSVYHGQQSSAAQSAATSTSVQATTTAEAPEGVVASGEFSAVAPTVSAPARWTLDGVGHVGTVPVAAHSPEGTTTTITVDGQGRRIAPPPSGIDVAAVSVFGTGALIGLVALALVVTRSALARVYDRRRDRDWDDALTRLLA